MCGLTTGLHDLLMCNRSGGFTNPLTIPVAALALFEMVFRAILAMRKLPPCSTQHVVRWDLRLHAALLAVYLVYCAAFFAG